MAHRIVIVGSGTAGVIAAGYLKRYWGDHVDITVVYDRHNPAIGVGESTTPVFFDFLNIMGLSFEDLVKNTGSTVKLGIKFKDWLGDGQSYFHNFTQISKEDHGIMAAKYAAKIAECSDVECEAVDRVITDSCLVPHTAYTGELNFAVHIDSYEFSRYIERVLGSSIRWVDGIVKNVCVNGEEIESIELEDGSVLTGDFFIDASGQARVLMGHLPVEWTDMGWYHPLNKAIPVWISNDPANIEPYTLAEATKHGWIWQIPLGHRYGAGFVYSDEFTTDKEADEAFDEWLSVNHGGREITNRRRIDFKPGHLDKNWCGNCLAIGLASGFVEPLESTSIHITIRQVEEFCMRYTLKNFKFDRDKYNQYIKDIWADTFDFIRFHYYTRRSDSNFWKHIAETTPNWIEDLHEKLEGDFINNWYFKQHLVFNRFNYCFVAEGLGLFNQESAQRYLHLRNLEHSGKSQFYQTVFESNSQAKIASSHSEFLRFLKSR